METVHESRTLRAEEFDTLKACIDVDPIGQNSWRLPVVDADWYTFCQTIYKGIEGREWEELCHHCESAVGDEGSPRQGS